jgi:hypothetical protein
VSEEGGLDLEGGDEPEGKPAEPTKPRSPRRGGGRPPSSAVSSELKGSIKGSLDELAEWLDGRDAELAATLRESSPQIAEFLAVHAAKRARLKRGIQYVFAKGGPFAALRAFGPIARGVGGRLGAWREDRAASEHAEAELIVVDEDGQAVPVEPVEPDGGGPVLPDS